MNKDFLKLLKQGDEVILSAFYKRSFTITRDSKRSLWIGSMKFDRNSGRRIGGDKRSCLYIKGVVDEPFNEPIQPRQVTLDLETLKKIRSASNDKIKNFIDLCFLTSRNICDLLLIEKKHIKDDYLEFISNKSGYLYKFKINKQLKALIERCLVDNKTDYLLDLRLGQGELTAEQWLSKRQALLARRFRSITKSINIDHIKHPNIYLMDICKLSSDLYQKHANDDMSLTNRANSAYRYRGRPIRQLGMFKIEVSELLDLNLIL